MDALRWCQRIESGLAETWCSVKLDIEGAHHLLLPIFSNTNRGHTLTLYVDNDAVGTARSRRVAVVVAGVFGILLATSGCSQMPWEELSPHYGHGVFPKTYRFKAVSPRLESVWTNDGKRLWTVGESGTILKSDDGTHWRTLVSGTETFLRSIMGTSDGRLWAVGDKGTILESKDGEHWDTCASGTQNDLRSLFVTSNGSRLWAVGVGGTILESEDGKRWSGQVSGTQMNLQAVLGSSDGKRVWAVGAGGTILESDDGVHWRNRDSGTGEYLWSIFSAGDGKPLWVLAADGKLLSSNDGAHWNRRTISTLQNLTAIFGASNSNRLWAVGNHGQILKSEDGENWDYLASHTESNLRSLVGTRDGRLLWAVGEQSTILQSEDGERWKPLMTAQDYLTATFGTNDGSTLWVVGGNGRILESNDGAQWHTLASGTRSEIRAIFATNDKHAWAVGVAGTILQSDDGKNWKSTDNTPESTLNSVFATDDGRVVWAVGSEGTILKSVHGEQWRILASGTSKELVSVWGTSNGEQLWVVGEKGTILESNDGEHWNPQSSATKNNLQSVFATSDGKHVWAVGAEGTILESDGTEHWISRASGTAQDLLSVFGTNDGKHLWAVGRKGTILQSDDGSHWNLRGSSVLDDLLSVFVTSDGNQLLAVGPYGTILQGNVQEDRPVVRQARIIQDIRPFLEIRIEKQARTPLPTRVWLEGRNDYDEQHQNPWRPLSQCTSGDPDIDQWRCSLQPSALSLEAGHKAYFLIHVEHGKYADVYGFATLYDPLQWIKRNSGWLGFAAALVVCIGLPTVLLFVRPLWNLTIYRTVGLGRLEHIKIPLFGDFVQTVAKLVTVLPWFVRHPRTLDAWVEKQREGIRRNWPPEATLNDSSFGLETTTHSQVGYIPLPIRVDNPVSGPSIERPSADEIGTFVKAPRTTIQLIGPGGAGKTTLARQISEWAIQSGPNSGLNDHPILPIWVDEELDSDKKTLPLVVKGRLIAALPDETIEDELFTALLKKQRLLVILDRVSERSSATQRYIETIYRSVSIGFLLLTSRTQVAIDGAQSKCIYPQPLNSSTLLNFMTGLLTVFMKDSNAVEQAESKPLSRIEEQLELGKRLAALIRLHTKEGEEDVPLVPLVVRLFVEQAVRLLQSGKTLDNLPLSLPDVYFRHLRQVNPDDPSVPHFLDGDRMLSVSKLLGKLAIGQDFIPKEFSKQQAVAALVAGGEAVTNSSDPIIRLTLNGVLLEKPGGLVTKFRFSLDPIAEFLAAAAYADECGENREKWETILTQSNGAPGFQIALKLVRQAYAENQAS